MFSVYSVQGRIFNGTLEQWRQVAKVSAPARTHAIRPTTQELRRTRAAAGEGPAAGSAGEGQRAAMAAVAAVAAYGQTRQGVAPRQPLSRVDEVMSRRAAPKANTAARSAEVA